MPKFTRAAVAAFVVGFGPGVCPHSTAPTPKTSPDSVAQRPADTMTVADAQADTLAAHRLIDSLRMRADSLKKLAAADSVLHPAFNDALGLDAEVRAALYDLLGDRVVPALARLQRVAAAPVALSGPAGNGALRGRQDLLFLLSQAQYRFGMDSAFRNTAETLLRSSPSPRYSSLLGAQMVLAAYRSGDYQRAVSLARSNTDKSTTALTALVGGLAAYQLHDYAGAHASFGAAAQGSPALAQYARYMDILTSMRADTAAAASGITALQSLASTANGEFADQVRTTAAQLAYERGDYQQAASLASNVSSSSGYAAEALLTQAWAQYKGGNIDAAGKSFAQFADRYPQLPARDESRLMAGQALLQLGQTAQAGQVFRAVVDSSASETRMLQSESQAAISDASRALVQARAAGLLFINDPTLGKTIALPDGIAADRATLVAAVSDTATAPVISTSADLVSLGDVQSRLSSVDSLAPSLSRRVFFMPASAQGGAMAYAPRAQALFAADLSVSTARYTLEQRLAALQARIALMQQLKTNLAGEHSGLAAMEAQLAQTQAQLADLMTKLDAAAARIRSMLMRQTELTRQAALDNAHMVDSLQRTMGAGMRPEDRDLLALEGQTIDLYRQVAELVASRLDTAIAHHPVLVLRDSVRARGQHVRDLLNGTQTALATAERLTDEELARLRGTEPPDVQQARSLMAAAEAQRASAESQLVAAVNAELHARAGELLADLRRDTEAAEFGTASSSFFQAMDQTGTGNGTTTSGATGTTGDAAGARTKATGTGTASGATRASSDLSARTPLPKQ